MGKIKKWEKEHMCMYMLILGSLEILLQAKCKIPDIGKSTGPRSSTGENSGGPMKTIVVPVLLSGKKKFCREPLYGDSNVEKKWDPVKVLGDP